MQIALALIIIVIMIVTKKKWIIIAGWMLVFVAGTLLYCIIYSSEMGRFDAGIVLAAIMGSVRNFLINNDFASYADKTDATTLLSLNIVYFLSVFMTLLTSAKIIAAYFSDNLYLFLYAKHRHICVFNKTIS